ncbi:hypothetical protein ACWDQL_03825 [Streptomyces olivaceus]
MSGPGQAAAPAPTVRRILVARLPGRPAPALTAVTAVTRAIASAR